MCGYNSTNSMEELIADKERNRLICQDVIQSVREGRSPLVLTERNEHLDSLTKQLSVQLRIPSESERSPMRTWRVAAFR